MISISETVRSALLSTRKNSVVVIVVGVLVLALAIWRASQTSEPPPARERPSFLARGNLLMCPAQSHLIKPGSPRDLMTRQDLESLAWSYSVKEREKAAVGPIFKVNEECRPGTAEELNLNRHPCSGGAAYGWCGKGLLKIPIPN